jgi:hypothetical protein
MKIGIIVASVATLLALALTGCGQSQPQLPPGYVMGPNGVPVPAAGVPGMPGVPGAVPGMPGAVPGVPDPNAIPGAVPAVPGVPPAVTPTAAPGAPASIGIPECDAYAARACNCNNEAMRATVCASATTSMQSWQAAIAASPASRDTIVAGCSAAEQGLRAACTQ